jgi:hypothetical protein
LRPRISRPCSRSGGRVAWAGLPASHTR